MLRRICRLSVDFDRQENADRGAALSCFPRTLATNDEPTSLRMSFAEQGGVDSVRTEPKSVWHGKLLATELDRSVKRPLPGCIENYRIRPRGTAALPRLPRKFVSATQKLLQRGVEQRVAEALGHLNRRVGPFLCEQEPIAWVVVDDSINTARWVKERVTQTDDEAQRSEEKKAYG